jgi:thiol-disulfide isomerase/thioredoxin
MMRDFNNAATRLREKRPAKFVARIDVDSEKRTKYKYKIQSYPTLLWFTNNGRDYEKYSGMTKTADVIVSWVMSKTNPFGHTSDAIMCSQIPRKAVGNRNVVYFGEKIGPMYLAHLNASKDMGKF